MPFFCSHVNYYNSLLTALPQKSISCLHLHSIIQNVAITQTLEFLFLSMCPQWLHWFLVAFGIYFQDLQLIFKANVLPCPTLVTYLTLLQKEAHLLASGGSGDVYMDGEFRFSF